MSELQVFKRLRSAHEASAERVDTGHTMRPAGMSSAVLP
jgi:hypothetical protein